MGAMRIGDEGGEFALIERLVAILPPASADVVRAIGDDAAFIAPDLVWTTDAVVEGVHVRRATSSMVDIGWKALAVTISDLAACAADPVAALVALTLPDDARDDVDDLYEGLAACARAFGCPVIGGDLSRGPALALAVTALGRTARPIGRDGARPGDLLCVTGRLGGSEAGRYLLEGLATAATTPDRETLVARHRRPVPRVDLAGAIGRTSTAMMDISDGVASDVRRLAAASDVRIVVDVARLPIDVGVDDVARALGTTGELFAATGGEDYELLFTTGVVPDAAVATVIGIVEPGPAAVDLRGAPADARGFDHFA